MREEFLKEFFPQNALDLEWELSRFHRSKGGIGFSKAIETIQNFVGESKIIKYPLNKSYETWRMPRGWNLKDGFLKISNGNYIVGSLALSPISAIFLSGKTNGIDLEAQIGKKGKEKPIILTAHLCHPKPGANDNASGSALLAEIVRTLRKFHINREITALWVPEMYGTIAYFTDHKNDFEFNINLDMVGEDQEMTGSTLDVSSTPWSLPSFINELMEVHLENPKFRMKTGHYSGGSDHYIFVDSSMGVQAVSLTQWPDRYYHTSEDTPDKSSVESFEWIGNGVLETLSNILEGMSEETSNKTVEKIFGKFISNASKDESVKNWIGFRTYESLEMLSKYTDVKDIKNYVKEHFNMKMLPKRKRIKNFKGPLGDLWMNEADKDWEFKVLKACPAYRDYKDEFLNFLDLGFNFESAVKLASEEFGIKDDLKAQSEYLVRRLREENLIG